MALTEFQNGIDPHSFPSLSFPTVALISTAYVFVYVGTLYLNPDARPGPARDRDDPAVVRARFAAALLSSSLILGSTLAILSRGGSSSGSGSSSILQALALAGLPPASPGLHLRAAGSTLALTALFYAGPIFSLFFARQELRRIWWALTAAPGQPGQPRGRGRAAVLARLGVEHEIHLWRDYLVAPLTEEVVFRSAILPLHLVAFLQRAARDGGAGSAMLPLPLLIASPLYFGIAHLNFAYENRAVLPNVLLATLAKTAYTSLFGTFACFVCLRTGSMPAAFVAHSFCNYFGTPYLGGHASKTHNRIYYALLFGGMVSFAFLVKHLPGEARWI